MRISIPMSPETASLLAVSDSFYHLDLDPGYVLFAGSRNICLAEDFTTPLINMIGLLGYCLLTGCAGGVDRSFREAFASSAFAEHASVACAFQSRIAEACGLDARKVVPHGLSPRVALARRTVWMANEASWLILFPSDPIGRGSALALRTMLSFDRPAFVITDNPPSVGSDYDVLPSNLFGLTAGYWCVPRKLRQPWMKRPA